MPIRCTFAEALQASGEQVPAPLPPKPAAHPEEAEQVLRWLEQPGVRLVELDGEWTCPTRGAHAHLEQLTGLGPALGSEATGRTRRPPTGAMPR